MFLVCKKLTNLIGRGNTPQLLLLMVNVVNIVKMVNGVFEVLFLEVK